MKPNPHLAKMLASAGAVALAAGQATPIIKAGDAIYHLGNPHLPEFRFEWHARLGKVYLVRKGKLSPDGREVGSPIAETVHDAEVARYVVGAWCIGYRQALKDRADAAAGVDDMIAINGSKP